MMLLLQKEKRARKNNIDIVYCLGKKDGSVPLANIKIMAPLEIVSVFLEPYFYLSFNQSIPQPQTETFSYFFFHPNLPIKRLILCINAY